MKENGFEILEKIKPNYITIFEVLEHMKFPEKFLSHIENVSASIIANSSDIVIELNEIDAMALKTNTKETFLLGTCTRFLLSFSRAAHQAHTVDSSTLAVTVASPPGRLHEES